MKARPHSKEAEMALIGACLLDTSVYHEIQGIVDAESFYDPTHAEIFTAIKGLATEGTEIDVVTVANRLVETESRVGAFELSKLSANVPTIANASHYAMIVADKSAKRHMGEIALQVLDAVTTSATSADVWAGFESQLSSAAHNASLISAYSQASVMHETWEWLERAAKSPGGITGLSTGFASIDSITRGLQDTHLIVLAARPAMGKSALAAQIATNVARDFYLAGDERQVVFVSLEMSRIELMLRALSLEAGIDGMNLKSAQLSDEDFQRLEDAKSILKPLPISYVDDGVNTPQLIVSRLRREHARKPIGFVVLDYLQLMDDPRAGNRETAVSACSRALKAIAKTIGCPVLSLAQLNRQCESRTDKRPQLSDLRESGAIEQDADIVAFLYREDYYDQDEAQHTGIAELRFAKHRGGKMGTIGLRWTPELTKFDDFKGGAG